MFSEEMKRGTLSVHQGLEKQLIARIRAIASPGDYVRLLELMYGFYHPLQQRLAPYLSDPIHHHSLQDRHSSRQAADLLDDIAYFTNKKPIDLPVCRHLPEIDSPEAALGALYVTEGSTLGGVIIAGMIAKRLDLPATKGFSFFNAYGEHTKTMWESFKCIIDKPRSDEGNARMLDAASATFSTFNQWIIKHEATVC